MGHGKLRKFAENETFGCLLQPAALEVLGVQAASEEDVAASSGTGLVLNDHPIKGHWNETMFAAPGPIVLELGCGKGEYTIGLAERMPERNYIGVDIKGARLWKGAKYAHEHGLPNVAFLRTRIEFIEAFFAPGEVSEIWLTFSDPQLKKENCRLTSPVFLDRYRRFLKPGGRVHLKTDSMFLHNYTMELARQNGLEVLAHTDDLYGKGVLWDGGQIGAEREDGLPRWGGSSEDGRENRLLRADMSEGVGISRLSPESLAAVTLVQTFYEKMFLQQGLPISYMAFRIDHDGAYVSPVWDADYWRAAEGPKRTFGHM